MRHSRPVSIMVITAPHGDAEESEPEGARGGACPVLDIGDPDDPAGEDEAVLGEEGGEGDAESNEGAVRHDAVRAGFVY